MEQHHQVYLYRRIVQAKLFIDAHFAEPIDLTQIADHASFSRFHFIRLFRSIYSMTPHQYLMHVRITNAARLLAGDMSAGEACHAVGFESISSFTTLFKKVNGCTPIAYKTMHHLRKQHVSRSPLSFIPECFASKNGWHQNGNSQ